MKRIWIKLFLAFLITFFVQASVLACELCKKNQPKVLKGITHGTGPQGDLDYIIIAASIVIVSITLFLSLKFLIRPNENNPDHIKNIIVNRNHQVEYGG